MPSLDSLKHYRFGKWKHKNGDFWDKDKIYEITFNDNGDFFVTSKEGLQPHYMYDLKLSNFDNITEEELQRELFSNRIEEIIG